MTDAITHRHVDAAGIDLHVAEVGAGPAVVFCHGFPDTWRGWIGQMQAVADAGYHAVAVDMRGYGRSAAPEDPSAYTPLHTAGDLVGLLGALELETATLVGHDFGASAAWYAAMMRPDRFPAVFCLSVPYLPVSQPSFLEQLAAAGQTDFYMFEQMRPEAVEAWADASVTIPACLYWTSGSPDPGDRWDPFDADHPMHRPAPVARPDWADAEDVDHLVAEFRRTGFRAPLGYYHSIQPFFDLARPFAGVRIEQPSFFLRGAADGLNALPFTEETIRAGLPGLRDFVTLDGVGHWPQREARDEVNRELLAFLHGAGQAR